MAAPKQIPLINGSYMSRSYIASAQRCVNLYADANPADAPFPFTFYSRPGLTVLANPPGVVQCRGLYTASNGDLYYVAGKSVFFVNAAFELAKLGELVTSATPVSMKDDGKFLLIVDGTTEAFKVALDTRLMTPYGQPGFTGADRVDYLDGFFVFNRPRSRFFYTSLLNSQKIDPTYVAQKSAATDELVRAVCVQRLCWLMGRKTSEVWGNVGAPTFPFQEIPGALVQHGVAAPYSVATHSDQIFFVEQNTDGKGTICMTMGYEVIKISTPAIEAAMAKYSTIADAIGTIYSILGRAFYQVSFPSADTTWVFDLAHNPPMPHEWKWADSDGELHRHRVQFATYAYGKVVGGDWQNGVLYEIDPFVYADRNSDMICIRGFPHSVAGGRNVEYTQFQGEFEVGQESDVEPMVSLRMSNTRGKSWSQPMARGLGTTGEYLRIPQWTQLGRGRDVVFELEWVAQDQIALNGAYVSINPTRGG